MQKAPLAALLLLTACGGASDPGIVARWVHEVAGELVPPAIGPESRLIVAESGDTGTISTLEQLSGDLVEGPLSTFPTSKAPVASGFTIVTVSTIGFVIGTDLGGEEVFRSPDTPLGLTSPLAVAGDGSLRIASSSGAVLGLSSTGETLFTANVGGPISTPLAIDAEGRSYGGTDTGRVVGIDATGTLFFDATVNAPASGVSVDAGGRVAVGEIDGVRVFDASGSEIFRRERDARVIGTRFLPSGEVIAWGEDGIVEKLDASGAVMMTFAPGPPIRTEVVPVISGGFAVFDGDGRAHYIDEEGLVLATFTLPGEPAAQVAVGEIGFIYVAAGKAVHALDFRQEL